MGRDASSSKSHKPEAGVGRGVRAFVALACAAVLVPLLAAGCSGGKDRDGDSMYDSQEKGGWDVTVDTLTERSRHHVTSDPRKADTDGDGLADNEEFFYGTDPRAADTDGDGLTDCQEVRDTNRSHCEDPAYAGPTDGGYGTDPKKADSDPGASLYVLNGPFTDRTGTLAGGRPDSGDGLPDGMELAGYTVTLANGATRFVHTSPRNGDSDGDHLDDGEEYYVYHSDPTVADTDGDGCDDGLDPLPALDEHYAPGLRNFTLQGDSGSAQLHLVLLVANVRIDVPPGNGGTTVQNGQSADLRGLEPAPVHSDQCSYTPRKPWILVQVLASDAATGRGLDVFTRTASPDAHAGGTPSVWWNVQTGRFSWQDDGAGSWESAKGVQFAGADGVLDLAPRVVGA